MLTNFCSFLRFMFIRLEVIDLGYFCVGNFFGICTTIFKSEVVSEVPVFLLWCLLWFFFFSLHVGNSATSQRFFINYNFSCEWATLHSVPSASFYYKNGINYLFSYCLLWFWKIQNNYSWSWTQLGLKKS